MILKANLKTIILKFVKCGKPMKARWMVYFSKLDKGKFLKAGLVQKIVGRRRGSVKPFQDYIAKST